MTMPTQPGTAEQPETTPAQNAARILLGSALIFAGIGHFTFARRGFRAQVPESLPLDEDGVVLASGVAEIALGASLIGLPARHRRTVGAVAASFFVVVFPGNISQLLTHDGSLGLNTETKRWLRLPGQPLFIAWAMWSTGLCNKRKG